MEFCTLLDVVKSIVINSGQKNLSWSFISLQKCGFKIINNYFLHTFTQLTSIRNRRQKFCLVEARKRRRRNSGYPYC